MLPLSELGERIATKRKTLGLTQPMKRMLGCTRLPLGQARSPTRAGPVHCPFPQASLSACGASASGIGDQMIERLALVIALGLTILQSLL